MAAVEMEDQINISIITYLVNFFGSDVLVMGSCKSTFCIAMPTVANSWNFMLGYEIYGPQKVHLVDLPLRIEGILCCFIVLMYKA